VSVFEIKTKWIADDQATNSVLAATLARIQIFLASKNITEYKSGTSKESALQIAAYYLAEWIVENWWIVLFEPRKEEDGDDHEFVARHSILAAQHGFALPSLSITPFGGSIHLSAAPRIAPYANAEFIHGASVDAALDDVQKTLAKFVDDTVDRLRFQGIVNTDFASVWEEIKSLSPEEREFCELVGALGLSPNEISDELSSALERIYDILGPLATRDFCLAATRAYVGTSVHGAAGVAEYLRGSHDTKLAPLKDVFLPSENYSRPSWARGMQAANYLREKFGINITDPLGADKIFERLNIDTVHRAHIPEINNAVPLQLPFSSAIDRDDQSAKVALLQDDELHRRFSAGRVTYLGWVSEHHSRRLATNALTRDQQASRSFAAEILTPQAFLKKLAGTQRQLHYDQIREIARERRVMPDVPFKQAVNAGIRVGSVPY
jgi:hypothetical protein